MKSQRKSLFFVTFPWLFMTSSCFFWLYLTFFFTEVELPESELENDQLFAPGVADEDETPQAGVSTVGKWDHSDDLPCVKIEEVSPPPQEGEDGTCCLWWGVHYCCNGHYNHTPDLGWWWCEWDLGLSVGAFDTRCEGTRLVMSLGWLSTRTLCDTSTRHKGTWLPLRVGILTRPLGKRMVGDEKESSSYWRRPRWWSLVFELVLKYSYTLGLNCSLNHK